MIEAMVQGQPITEYQPVGVVSNALRQAWQGVLSILNCVEAVV